MPHESNLARIPPLTTRAHTHTLSSLLLLLSPAPPFPSPPLASILLSLACLLDRYSSVGG